MIKIAILGSENSHCAAFASVLAPKSGEKIFPDLELIGVYGDPNEVGVPEGNEAVAKKSTCTVFAQDKDAFLAEADAVMVTARNGANHYKYAENYIKKGIPVWIDKPITNSTEEVNTMVRQAQVYGAVLSGGSSLEYAEGIDELAAAVKEAGENLAGGHVSAPVNLDNPYGGFWFYTQHLVGMMTRVFGCDVRAVQALKTQTGVHAVYDYGTFTVSAYYGGGYSVSVYTNGYAAQARTMTLGADFFMPELRTFYEVIKTGKPDKTVKEYIAPVYILEATIAAYEENRKVCIEIPEVL